MAQGIIFFEMNEIPWRVIQDFVAEYPKSALATVLPRTRTYETYAEDTDLSPWITWPTVHRGVANDRHAISDFGQNLDEVNQQYPAVWELLRKAGVPCGVFGSFHSYPMPQDYEQYAFFVPDVFAAGSECFPKKIERFQNFNLSMSRKNGRNVNGRLPLFDTLKFLGAMPGLGLKPETLLEVGLHMLDERMRRWTKIRRRTYQVRLAFDVFLKQLKQSRPRFATFFTNHVASSMHRYWAARYPKDYSEFGMEDQWVKTFCYEIEWTMRMLDKMLGQLVRFVERNPQYQLWMASSMGQAATDAYHINSQVYLNKIGTFLSALGFGPDEWEERPAMLPRVIIELKSPRADELEQRLKSIRVADRGPLGFKRLEHNVFRIHPMYQGPTDEYVTVAGEQRSFASMGFANVPLQESACQTAYHIPAGSLLIYDPRANYSHEDLTSISTQEIAPMILKHFGVERPQYMQRAAVIATG